ncbi:MAG: G5 domain-containing protein [Clostridia bacterium]|nr:G5 domain-containing protein [Clostridia bacterium]
MTSVASPQQNRQNHTSVRRICLGAAVSILFAASLTMTFTSLAATVYNVGVAGKPALTQVHTFRSDPVEIVNSVGVRLQSDDQIDVTPINGGVNSNVIVYRSGKATVDVDGEERTVDTDGNVAQTIAGNGISLRDGDEVNVDLDSLAYDGMKIRIDRAFDVHVEDGDTVYTYRTTGCKAGEAIYSLGLQLGDEDELDVPPQTELTEETTVRVLRCVYEKRTALEKVKYDTTYIDDSSMTSGHSRVVSQGEYGLQEVRYRDKYVGKKCVSSEVISKTVIKDPVDEVKAVGTHLFTVSGRTTISPLPLPDEHRLDENGVPTNYKSYFDGVATAYTDDPYTASGLPAGIGYVAVNPKVIPYGTKLWVVSLDGQYVYGYAIAADTGGFVYGGKVDMDLYMENEEACRQFGVRGVRIYIL